MPKSCGSRDRDKMMFVVGNCGAHLSLVLLVVATYSPLSTTGQQSSSVGTYRLGLVSV